MFRNLNVDNEILAEFNDKNLSRHLDSYHLFLDSLINLNETLTESKAKMADWEIYSETLTIKFILHANSLYQLYQAPEFDSKQLNRKLKFLDISSILVLTRTLLECFLMFCHIYINPANKEEQEFRFMIWAYSSLVDRKKNRKARQVLSQEFLEKEEKELEDYKTRLTSNKLFQELSKKQQNTILTKGQAKLFKDWRTIIDETNLADRSRWKELYSYLSGFSHSEGLSAAKIRHNFNNDPTYRHEEAVLFCFSTNIMICKMIVELVKKHKIIEIKFNTFSDELQQRIKFYSNVGSEKRA